MQNETIDRRKFLRQTSMTAVSALLASAIPMGVVLPASATEYEVIEGYKLDPALIHQPKDFENMTEFEKAHVPTLKMPLVAEDGSTIPFYAVSDHPMEKDHYIQSVEILNFNDPIIHKGMIEFSPANGEVYFSSQIRAVSGTNTIMAVMKCNKHGRWVGKATVKVTVGGC
ncbi:MAG: thiosulfate oxidation carrier protein SoxY [Nitrospinota bacterium]